MKYRRYTKALALLLLPTWLWACSSELMDGNDLAMVPGSDLECINVSKCAASSQCIANRCVAVSQASIPITLRLSNPQNPHAPLLLETEFVPGQSLGTFGQPDLVDTSLRVQYQKAYIGGVADFSRQSKFSSLIGSQSLSLSSNDNKQTNPKLALIPGVYDITVFPAQSSTQDQYPTMFFPDVEIDGREDLLTLNLDQKVSSSESQKPYWLTTATGVVNVEGVSDVDIRLQDRNSPASTARIPICVANVCNPSFEALLPPQAYDSTRSYDVIASIKALPTLVISEKLAQFDASSSSSKSMRGNLVIPPVEIKPFSVLTIQGKIVSTINKSTSNATVVLTAMSTDGRHKWISTAHEPSDVEGYFRIDIPQYAKNNDFEYLVSLVFEASNPHATEYFSYNFSESESFELTAKAKYHYRGVVSGAEKKQFVEGATVVASPIGQYGNNETIETVTDVAGAFSLALDAIPYSISITPPKRMGLPAYVDSFLPERGDVFVDATLKAADLIYGTCINSDGEGVRDVRVEVFVDMPKLLLPVRIASSVSDDEGVFRLFVPALDDHLKFLSVKPKNQSK